MIKLSVIIPVFNEELQLNGKMNLLKEWKNEFSDDLEIIIMDSNSTDNSETYFAQLRSEKIAEVLFLSVKDPLKKSIGTALSEACLASKANLIVILPIDILITSIHIKKLLKLKPSEKIWGCFTKSYDSDSPLMKIYAYLQNQFLTILLQQGVWTNVFFFSKELSTRIPTDGFLEDVLFCDRLKQVSVGHIIDTKVVVSTRKYMKDGHSRRIASNGIIILLYRCGYKNISVLKEFYVGRISFIQLIKQLVNLR